MSDPGALPPEILAEIKAGFFVECDELLSELELGLLLLKRGERDAEIIGTVFRAVHSIKGGGASFGLDDLVHFAHGLEGVLAAIRSERLGLNTAVIDLLLRAADVLADRVRAVRDGRQVEVEAARDIERDLSALLSESAGGADRQDGVPPDEVAFAPIPADVGPNQQDSARERDWIIHFRPHRSLYAHANEPLVLLRELRRLGPTSVILDDSELPPIQDLNPEDAYLLWTITLKSRHGERTIRDVFEFVEGHCDIEILIGSEQRASAPAGREKGVRQLPIPTATAEPRRVPSEGTSAEHSRIAETIRVDLRRVDRLINLASELVINQAMLAQRLTAIGGSDAQETDLPLDEMHRLTRELQDSIMGIRAQPVQVVFQRMSRLVREVEAATGKQVSLITEGETTELDRTVIERLIDPLTHMIRNAIDHGIEPPDQRIAAGKTAQGTVRLTAAHRNGRVVIEASDDGRGIDRVRVRAVACAQGLIAADAVLTDHEIDNLIFRPGFSTAEKVTEISGRGVGMDIVKRGVQAIGGRISVTSNPGMGTTLALSLPLTLAVLDGMLVSVCGQTLVVPLTSLLETIQPPPADMHSLGMHTTLLSVRGDFVPVIDLGAALAYRKERQPQKGVVLLVEDDSGCRTALLVDDVLGQRQVVIKSLQANYCGVDGIAAATILGDGRVALIVDVNAILLIHSRGATPVERRVATG